jgi:hypothetical protein
VIGDLSSFFGFDTRFQPVNIIGNKLSLTQGSGKPSSKCIDLIAAKYTCAVVSLRPSWNKKVVKRRMSAELAGLKGRSNFKQNPRKRLTPFAYAILVELDKW